MIPGELAGGGRARGQPRRHSSRPAQARHPRPLAPAPEAAHEGILHDLLARVRWAGTMTGQEYAGVLDWLREHRPAR